MGSDDGQWKVSYLSWTDFQQAVFSEKGTLWDKMIKGDLVIGEMDFSIDFLYFFLSFSPDYKLADIVICLSSSPSSEYHISPLDCCTFFSNMQILAKETMVWPHPKELFLSGTKLQGYKTIRVTLLSMDLSVPMYVLVDDVIGLDHFRKR